MTIRPSSSSARASERPLRSAGGGLRRFLLEAEDEVGAREHRLERESVLGQVHAVDERGRHRGLVGVEDAPLRCEDRRQVRVRVQRDPVRPQLAKVKGVKLLCVYAEREEDTLESAVGERLRRAS